MPLFETEAHSDVVARARKQTTGRINVRNELVRKQAKRVLADLISKNRGRLKKSPQDSITTRDLPVEVAMVLGKKLDRGRVIEAIIEAVEFRGKEIISEPSKWLKVRPPKPKPRSTDAAVTEAIKDVLHKRNLLTGIAPAQVRTPGYIEPWDSAGSSGWGGPTGRTAHANV